MKKLVTTSILFCLLGVSVLLTGCGMTIMEPVQPLPKMVWPAPPLPAKIEWVKEVRDLQNLGQDRGFWARVRDLFVGEERTLILRPYGVYCDDSMRLFIADTGSAVVHVKNLQNDDYAVIGAEEKASFKSPIGVTGDENGMIYITDSLLAMVFRYSSKDRSLNPFITSGLKKPTGIAYNRVNRLIYVSDTAVNQIIAFDLEGNEKLRFGKRGELGGQFNYPTDLAVDRWGRVIVTDSMNARIAFFDPDGIFLSAFGEPGDSTGTFAKPKGVAVDSEGNIYVSDALFDAVQIFDETGMLLLAFGETGGQPGQFWMPSGIFIDRNNFIYVSDTYNQRIQVFKFLGAKMEPNER